MQRLSLYTIAKKHVPGHITVDYAELDKEWRNQSLLSDIDAIDSTDIVGYWKNILGNKTANGGRKFVQLPILEIISCHYRCLTQP